MKVEKTFQILLFIEAGLMGLLILLFYLLSPSNTGYYKIYELFGALFASMITTFGLYKMRKLT